MAVLLGSLSECVPERVQLRAAEEELTRVLVDSNRAEAVDLSGDTPDLAGG